MAGQFGVRNFRVTGSGAMDETLTPNPNVDWRILSIKLHVVGVPATAENFVIQVNDPTEVRYNTILITEAMNGVSDVVQHYEGTGGITLVKNQRVDFDWANADNNEWGLTVSYVED